MGATTSYEEAHDLRDGAFREAESGYRHLDARGSVVARSDFAAGGVAEEAVYGPWGAVLDVGLTTVTPEHTFLGSEADSGTGWHRFGPRAYDPTLRRWTSADPLGLTSPSSVSAGASGLNLFGYADNNPASKSDASGLCPACIVIPIVLTLIVLESDEPAKDFGSGNGPTTFSEVLEQAPVTGPIIRLNAAADQLSDSAAGGSDVKIATDTGDVLKALSELFIDIASLSGGRKARKGGADANDAARAGHNGFAGPVRETRKTIRRGGEKHLELEFPDGSTKSITKKRVKEFVRNRKAPKGMESQHLPVKFRNAQPGSKGKKRNPTPKEKAQVE